MKLTLEFGRKARHAQGARQEALEAAVQALSDKLKAERHKNNYLVNQNAHLCKELNKLLAEKRGDAMTVELPLMETTKEIPIVVGGPARFQLKEGRVEP